MCNPNLLINTDFRNPVNQRGKSSYILGSTKYEYCLDMCAGGNLTVTIHNGYVNLKSDKNERYKRLGWRIEPLAKGTYTISARIKVNEKNGRVGLYYSEDLIVSSARYTEIPAAGFEGIIQFTFTVEDKQINWCGAEIVGQNTTADYYDIDIYAVKLEKGAFSTLANEVVDYAAELRKCQRYLQAANGVITKSGSPIIGFGECQIGRQAFVFIPSIVPMRTIPTIITVGEMRLWNKGIGIPVESIKSVSYSATTGFSVIAMAQEELTTGAFYELRLNSIDSNLILSAEL